jgi:hypothetical protein
MSINFEVYEIYLYFNQPCLLSYVNKLNNYYLAVWIEEPSLYLFSKVNWNDLQTLKEDKKLLCRDLFVNSTHSFLYDVELKQIVKELQVIPEDYLPLNE